MKKELRRIPYGIMNWAEVVHECHFVDNTRYLRELEKCNTPIFLRPKRFGKSLVCSMLEHYYDYMLKDRFEELFGQTEIGRDPTGERNGYLILKFDFSTIQVGSIDEIERNFVDHVRLRVSAFAARYGELADWSSAVQADNAAKMIERLRSVVQNNELPPIYVIIDEYDNFTNELVVSNRDAEYDAVCGHDNQGASRESFFKAFFKSFKAGLEDGTIGRTYFTGVLPITLDDLSSGCNVGTVVNLRKELFGLVGFTQTQVERYVDEIFEEHGLDAAMKPTVLGDLKRLYDGYRFLPDAEPLYNSTICNWYLFNLTMDREIPFDVIDANVRTDIAWFRRLAVTNARALAKVRAYIERGEGEQARLSELSAKFGRAKFFSEAFYPYALYYLGLLTFEDRFTLTIPNLTIRNMFVDYYDELSEFTNIDAERTAFVGACRELTLKNGTWANVFEQYWQHYVKERIPAQAFDKMNENFFRTTFTSRCLDTMTMFYSFETEYNTPEGRCDFLAIPKPNFKKSALLIEFKYFSAEATDRDQLLGRQTPDAETAAQARDYARAITAKSDWGQVPLEVAVVEICSNRGYNWLSLDQGKSYE